MSREIMLIYLEHINNGHVLFGSYQDFRNKGTYWLDMPGKEELQECDNKGNLLNCGCVARPTKDQPDDAYLMKVSVADEVCNARSNHRLRQDPQSGQGRPRR